MIKNNFVVLENKDHWGRTVSENYYSKDDNSLIKEVFYMGKSIAKINYYKDEVLYKTEEFKEGAASKILYNKHGGVTYRIDYDKKNRIQNVIKYGDNELSVTYEYDKSNRIIMIKSFINKLAVSTQFYVYDKLGRVVEYKDDNQVIKIADIGKGNGVASYTIIDNIGHETHVNNSFDEEGYVSTEIVSGYETINVEEESCANNIMLKKPDLSENNLDTITSNLFKSVKSNNTNYAIILKRTSSKQTNNNMKSQVLPITIRKRFLYNLMLNGFTN